MKRENNKKFKKRKRNQNRSLTCRVLSMMFAIVLFCSTVLINTDYVSQASSFDDMVDMVEVEEDSAAADTSEDTGDDLDTDVNFESESEEGSAETYSESDDFGSSDADFSSGENMFTDGTSESSAPAEEAAQPVSCIVNLKNETIEVKAEAPAGVLPNGTQMIVKGHDFANVTLVGVLAADLSLHANDYRAGERTFQLLTQAAGRAGRGDKPGEVVIQTYSPEHYSIQTAAKQDYHAFYKEEISYRSLMRYPPEWQMLVVFASGEDKAWLDKVMDAMANVVKHMDLMVIGPSEAGFGKINDQYRKVIYIKNKDYETLVKAKNRLEQWIDLNKIRKNLLVNFDFNPMNSY